MTRTSALSEYDVDEWPNGGISSLPGKPDVFACGFIPPGLFASVEKAFLELARQRKVDAVTR